MHRTHFLFLSCALALSAIACGGSEPAASEATEPQAAPSTGAEAPPAPVAEAPPAPAPAPEPITPAAAPPAPAPAPPAFSVLLTHKVKDFAAWKPVFDADEPARKSAGIVGHGIMTDPAKPGVITLWLPTNDLDKALAFGASPELKAKMKEAGVIGKPTIVPLKSVDMSPPTGQMGKFGAIVDHKVKDYAAWKTAFDSHAQFRTDAGITAYAVSQDPKDANHVIVWLEANDKDKLIAFGKSPELKAKMKEGGVKGAPKVTILEIGEMKMYQ